MNPGHNKDGIVKEKLGPICSSNELYVRIIN